MIEVLIGLVIVVVATGAYVALRNAQDFSDANEIIPGRPTGAPKAWAGAHSREAKLHRRLRDAMTALRANRALDEPALVPVREALEREALEIGERLVAAAALPKDVRTGPLDRVAGAVDAIERAVADVVVLRGPGAETTAHAIEEVRARLSVVEQARLELQALGGTSPALGELRRSIESSDDVDAGEDEGHAGGAPGAPQAPR